MSDTSGLNLLDNQQKFILLIALPCIFTMTIALIHTEVSGYFIAFLVFVFILLTTYGIVAIRQVSDFQIRTLSNLIESMIDGDYSLRGRLQTNQAFQELFNLINQLSDTLARHKFEAKESRLLLEKILEQMHAMVLATDQHGKIVMTNDSAKKYIFQGQANVLYQSLTATVLGAEISQAKPGIIRFSSQPLIGEYFLVKEQFLAQGQPHQLYFITNAERLLIEQERKAWQSLVRVLSHEMNNSMTPIAAISQSMQNQLSDQSKAIDRQSLAAGVDIINERAKSLTSFIASYSQLSHLPKPNKVSVGLYQMLQTSAALFPKLTTEIDDSCQLMINVDKQQFEQVLINLFKNALEAMLGQACALLKVSVISDEFNTVIRLVDQGCGIANFENLFVPFYSTKASGSGIGLALCRQIMFNHHGTISVTNVKDGHGVEVQLSLPVDKHALIGGEK
ncbi:sensor histidine kinase [Thalassotalea insulae]|uniref:sensor histidine kinase n=1 Tax=Thalassotalea insulae TaxID=2056778 RepID=UPI0024E07EE7|nr:ATP-binding protein [Thalassotalea insulae]